MQRELSLAAGVFVLVSLGASSSADAASDADKAIARCAAVANSIGRLECYDALAAQRGVDKPKVSTRVTSKWRVRTEKSPIDDSTNISLDVDADEDILNQYERPVRPHFVIECRESRTQFSVWWGGIFIGSDSTQITYRVDSEKAKKVTWSISTKHEHTGRWRGTGIAFIKSLFNKRRLLVRVVPHSENQRVATFDISGIESAIKPLREACSW